MVAVCPEGQPLNMLNLSLPTCFSSNTSQEPSTFQKEVQKPACIQHQATTINTLVTINRSQANWNGIFTSSMTLFTEV